MPARTFPEVALSIIAEIVTLRRSQEKKAAVVHEPAELSASPLVEDPVCHMRIDPRTAAASFLFARSTYYFCNVHCKNIFEKDPRKYLSIEGDPGMVWSLDDKAVKVNPATTASQKHPP